MAGRRRRRAEGSVRAVPGTRGAWQLRWVEDTPQGRRRVSKTCHGTYRQACAALEAELARVRAQEGGTYGGTMTVAKAHEIWLETEGRDLAPNTLYGYGRAWERLAPRFGRTPARSVRALDVQAFMLSDGMSAAMADKCLNVMRNVMRTAKTWGAVEFDPLAGVRWKMPEASMRRDATVTDTAGLARVCEAFRGSPIEAAVILMGQGGLRVGEALGVGAGDVSALDAGGSTVAVVAVRRTVGDTGRHVREATKTGGSTANAYVSAPWSARLLELAGEARAAGRRWMCDGLAGRPIGKKDAREMFYAGLDAAGLPRMLLKNLRPSFEGSRVYDAGIPVEQVARLMRHADVATTLRHYDRPSDAQLAAVAAKAAAGS